MSTIPYWIGFDIETKPRPDLVEKFCKPFPEFDEKAVKTGNLKDPAKVAEKISLARADHEQERTAYWAKQKEDAALNPFTGEVLVVGTITEFGERQFLHGNSERATLELFWGEVRNPQLATTKWLYWSGNGDATRNFDLDYLVTRSRILGVHIPALVRSGRFYHSRFVDLAAEFLLFQRDRYCSLTKAAELMGLYDEQECGLVRKQDDDLVTGATFWQWWDGTARDDIPKEAQETSAIAYLRNDLNHLRAIAPRIL